MKIKLLIDGGDMKPGPAISQKLGPAGINIGKVIQEVNSTTSAFKGMKVPVELDVDTKSKKFTVSVKSPPASELLKKELKIELGSGTPNSIKVANASIEQIISVAKTKESNMLAKDFRAAVKSVVGNCTSMGILIENKNPKEIEKEIDEGKYDSEIKQKKSETQAEKIKSLDKYFAEVKAKQDAAIKKAQEEKAAEEAKKEAAAATGAAQVATGVTATGAEKGKPTQTTATTGVVTSAKAPAEKSPEKKVVDKKK